MDTALSPPVGQLLGGRYHVGSRIARGGMATVYLGTDTRLDRVVALKIAHPELSDDAEFVRRFIGEARSAARLSSPHVVGIFDQGSDKRLHYIAMEYVPGRTLRQLLNERGRLSAREALDIMAGVLAGLAAAHEAGFAHRDVKPENVLLTASGGVKVADFGLARAVAGAVQTKGGMIIGTAAYLAPEQVSGGASDARTDVYAAGIMLFELLTGVQPHTAESPLAVAYKHVNEVVPAPSSFLPGLSISVDALVAMATSRDPELRPANAGQFLRAISEFRDGRAQPGTAPYSAPGGTGPGLPPYPGSVPHGQPYQAPAPQAASGPYGQPTGAPYPDPAAGPYADPAAGPYAGQTTDSGPQQAPGAGGSRPYAAPYGAAGPFPDDERGRGVSGPIAGYDPAGHSGQSWAPSTGAVGASALPSLSPQSVTIGPVLPAPHAQVQSQVNNTLIVSDATALGEYDDYGDGPGHRVGSSRDSGRYRGRRVAQPRSGSLLQRSLFGRRSSYIAGALAVAVVIALIVWWLSAGQYQTIPPLHGVAVGTARGELANLGLHAKLGDPVHSPLPKGEVISTSPAIGQKAASGSSVTLIVSLGPVIIQVPNVSGQPLVQAEAQLRAAHLKPGKVTQVVSNSVPVGDVISTTPRAYSQCPQTRPVGLAESAGPGLPDFRGQQVSAAQATAVAGGYTINAVQDANGSQPTNTIVSQSPPPNTPITPGEVVTVYFSPGPPGVPVPNVQGMSVQDAMVALQQAGFAFTVNHVGPGDRVGSYSPQGVQPKGTTITLNVGIFSGF